MNSRERVNLTFMHEEPDRVPIDLGSTKATSIMIGAYKNILSYYALNHLKVEISDTVQQMAVLGEPFLEKIGADFLPIDLNPPSSWQLKIVDEGSYYSFFDEWGSKLRMPRNGGHYYDRVEFPLKDDDVQSLREYRWPDPDDKFRVAGLAEKARNIYEKTDYVIVGSPLFGGGIFEQSMRMRGMAEFLMDLAANRKYAELLMNKLVDIYMQMLSNFIDEVGIYLDVIYYADDLGMQNGSLISLDLYRKLIKPGHKKIFDFIKRKSHAKIFYHCCGAISEFIPDFIDLGIDILNPVQVSALGMDTRWLKKEFGSQLIFWGGGCDTQRVLPFGTPEEVRTEVKSRIGDLAPGGGFVFCQVHNIQDNVPAQNIAAMYETVNKFGRY
ncbi:MAG: uroporphyrinogen-III decarboxylase [Actinobacteria bacterium]|nr:uroporphyrinogen-III decarboxylase [Actinomycetota bacterium]